MKTRSALTLSLAVALNAVLIQAAYAETPAEAAARDLDITMTISEDESPDEMIQRIELPLNAAEQGVLSSQRGLDIANTARSEGREFGAAVSEQARTIGESARDLGDQGGATVRDAVRDAISSGDRDNIPREVRDNLRPQVRDNIPTGPGNLSVEPPSNPGQ